MPIRDKDLVKPIDKPKRDKDTGKLWINIDISNDAIRYIKSAISFYEGDKDDPDNEHTKEEVRKVIHQVWKQLNPS